jgi:vesicle-fusing ATPase
LISPDSLVGYTEVGKINHIVKVFEDAYRSNDACIIIDNLERLIDYVDIGPNFSNNILQTILVLIKKIPTKQNCRLLILGLIFFINV